MQNYVVLGRMGEGAHGVVVRARNLLTGQAVALKKVPLRKLDQGMPLTALREIRALQEVNSNNVVSLLDVFAEGTGFVLVFELMQGDLGEMIRDATQPLTPPLIKAYLQMILTGVAYLHDNNIMHRDLKPANLLISNTGQLKVADFGLCRVFVNNSKRVYSHQVATRWYRAPELLYGSRTYDEGVDLWAIGCILGEMINCSPVFPGESDIDQLRVVLQTLGTPNEESWPGLTMLPDYKKITFPDYMKVALEKVLPDATPDAMDLLNRFLVYYSEKRIRAKEALQHVYFSTYPIASDGSKLPLPPKLKPAQAASEEYISEYPTQDILARGNQLIFECKNSN